jgi:adenosylhomocysteine nucleosidase
MIGIVVALREELTAVESAVRASGPEAAARVRMLRGGMGGAMAAAAAHKLLGNAPQVRLLISCGFSGGLSERLAVGDLFLATAVRARPSLEQAAQSDEPAECSKPALDRAKTALAAALLAFHEGVLVTLAQPVLRSEDKRALGQLTGAQAVDMEAAAVVRVAKSAGVAFAALRTISDGVNDALPPEVATFLDEQGRVRTGKVLKFAAGGPSNLKELWRLKSRSDRAASALEAALRVAIPAWLQGD